MGRFGEDGDLDGALLLLASKAGGLHDRRDHRGRWRPGDLLPSVGRVSRCTPISLTNASRCIQLS